MTTNPVPHVLIVDDEADMRELLCDLIESNGLRATAVEDGATMRVELDSGNYALLILDLRLRREDGLTLARAVRETSAIPIMILTGKGDETDRILGLELAADDYLMKPFNPRELLARVRALLRRAGGEFAAAKNGSPASQPQNRGGVAEADDHETARFGDWTLDLTDRVLRDQNNQPCPLTPSEYALLEDLMRHKQQIRSRAQLEESLYAWGEETGSNTVEVFIHHLRKKFGADFIRTIRGLGYQLGSSEGR